MAALMPWHGSTHRKIESHDHGACENPGARIRGRGGIRHAHVHALCFCNIHGIDGSWTPFCFWRGAPAHSLMLAGLLLAPVLFGSPLVEVRNARNSTIRHGPPIQEPPKSATRRLVLTIRAGGGFPADQTAGLGPRVGPTFNDPSLVRKADNISHPGLRIFCRPLPVSSTATLPSSNSGDLHHRIPARRRIAFRSLAPYPRPRPAPGSAREASSKKWQSPLQSWDRADSRLWILSDERPVNGWVCKSSQEGPPFGTTWGPFPLVSSNQVPVFNGFVKIEGTCKWCPCG